MITHPYAKFAVGVVAALLGAVASHAAPPTLAELVPSDTLVYVEWAGHDHLQASGGGDSAFGKLMARPEFKRLMANVEIAARTALQGQTGTGTPGAALAESGVELAGALWSKGAALAVVGVEMAALGPEPQLALAVPAGSAADELSEKVLGVLQGIPLFPPPVDEQLGAVTFKRFDGLVTLRVGVLDGTLLVLAGEPTAATVLSVKDGQTPSLASSERYRSALEKIGTKGRVLAAVAHVDVQSILRTAEPLVGAMTGAEGFPPPVTTVLDALGIAAIQTVTFTEQIADGGHRHSLFVAAPGPKRGLLRMYDFDPVTDSDLIVVPADARFAKAVNFRLSDVFDEAMRLIQAVSVLHPELPETVNTALSEIEAELGLKIREDVLDVLDDGWVIFDAPSHGGLFGSGLTAVVETKDAKRAEELVGKAIELLRAAVGEDRFAVSAFEHAGHKINCLTVRGLPVPVAPAWAFHKQRLIMALYPQIVAQTVERLASPAAASFSILENADFVRARKLLPAKCSSIVYVDTKTGVSDLYSLALPLVTAGFSAAQGVGVQLDVTAWPPRDVFTQHLFGDGWAVSTDDNGVLVVGHGPWPVPVPPLSAMAPLIGSVAAGAALSAPRHHLPLLPLLPTADAPLEEWQPAEPAEVFDPVAALQAISVHVQLYAMMNKESFPPALATLTEEGELDANLLVVPPEYGGSFTYIGGQTLKSDPNNVLVYCSHPDLGGCILTVAGDVSALDHQTIEQLVQETGQRLGQ